MSFQIKLLYEINLNDCITSLDFSQTGDLVSVGLLDETVYVWKHNMESQSLQEVYKFKGNTLGVVDVKFSSYGNMLAVSSLDSMIRLYNLEEGNLVNQIVCKPMECWKIQFDSTGRSIFSTGELGLIKKYDIDTAENIEIIKTQEIFATSMAYSKNTRYLSIGNNIGHVFILDLFNEKKISRIESHGKIVRSVQFTCDSLKLISCSDDLHINIIDTFKMCVILTLTGHRSNINQIDTHPTDPKLFVTCSYDKQIKLWDLEKKAVVENINYHLDNIWVIKFTPNGKQIASGSENGLLAFHQIMI